MAEHARGPVAAAAMREQGEGAAKRGRQKRIGGGFPFEEQRLRLSLPKTNSGGSPSKNKQRRARLPGHAAVFVFIAAQERGKAQSKACAM